MNLEMKKVDELYFELRKHPDCIYLDIIDREQVVYDVRNAIEYLWEDIDDDNELDKLAGEWYEDNKTELKSRLSNFYEKNLDDLWEFNFNSIIPWFTMKKNFSI